MSIATQITRLQGLRDRIKAKLSALGIGSSLSDLKDCTEAIEGIGGTQVITDTSTVDVAGKQYARVEDAYLVPGNIVSGVSILGVTGTASVSPPTASLTTGIFSYGGEAAPSTLVPPTGYDGFSRVVTQLTDALPMLVAGNIKSGVTIMGVAGTYKGVAFQVYTDSASASSSQTLEVPFPQSYTSMEVYRVFVTHGAGSVAYDGSRRHVVFGLSGYVGAFAGVRVAMSMTSGGVGSVTVSQFSDSDLTAQPTLHGGIAITMASADTLFDGDYDVTIVWR